MEKKSGLLSGAHWRPLGVTPDSGGLLQREETARSESHVSGMTVLLKKINKKSHPEHRFVDDGLILVSMQL